MGMGSVVEGDRNAVEIVLAEDDTEPSTDRGHDRSQSGACVPNQSGGRADRGKSPDQRAAAVVSGAGCCGRLASSFGAAVALSTSPMWMRSFSGLEITL